MSFLAKPRANLQGRAQRPQRHLPRRVEEKFSFLALKKAGHRGKAAVGAACLALPLTPTCMSFIPPHTSSGVGGGHSPQGDTGSCHPHCIPGDPWSPSTAAHSHTPAPFYPISRGQRGLVQHSQPRFVKHISG